MAVRRARWGRGIASVLAAALFGSVRSGGLTMASVYTGGLALFASPPASAPPATSRSNACPPS